LHDSYNNLQTALQNELANRTKELSLPADKASLISEKVLHIVVEHRQGQMHRIKGLLDHLIKVGQKSAVLEKRMDKELHHMVKEEERHDEHDQSTSMSAAETGHGSTHDNEEDSDEDGQLKRIVGNLFKQYDEFKVRFRAVLAQPHVLDPVHSALNKWAEAHLSNASDVEIREELDKHDLKRFNIEVSDQISAQQFMQELLVIPSFKQADFDKIQQEWQAGTKTTMQVVEVLEDLHEHHGFPEGWVVDSTEAEEATEVTEEQQQGTDGQHQG